MGALSFHTPAPVGYWLGAGKVNSWALIYKGKGIPVTKGQASSSSHVQAARSISKTEAKQGAFRSHQRDPRGPGSTLTVSTTHALPISGNGTAILLVAQAPVLGVIIDLLCLTPPSNPLVDLVGNTFKIHAESDHFFKVTFENCGKLHITHSSLALSTFTFLGTHHYHPSTELFPSCKAETLYLLSISFIHSSVDGHLGCFYLLTVHSIMLL